MILLQVSALLALFAGTASVPQPATVAYDGYVRPSSFGATTGLPEATADAYEIPKAVHFVGRHDRTYLVYGNVNSDPMILFYDHAINKWLAPVQVGATGVPYDAHGNPCLAISPDGYLHVLYGSHGGAHHLRRSSNPEDITAWDPVRTISPSATYAYAFFVGNTLYWFHRSTPGWGFRTSDDGGVTWSDFHLVMSHYPTGTPYPIWGIGNEKPIPSLHVAWLKWDGNWHDIHYAVSYDLGETWQGTDGTPIALPMVYGDGELVYVGNTHGWIDDVLTDPAGRPVILFNAGGPDIEGDYRAMLAYWTGSAWRVSEVCTATSMYAFGQVLVKGVGQFRVVWAAGRWNGGEVAMHETTDGGQSWQHLYDVTKDSPAPNAFPTRVLNDPYPELQVFWCSGDDAHRPGKVHAWGENGYSLRYGNSVVWDFEDNTTQGWLPDAAARGIASLGASDGKLQITYETSGEFLPKILNPASSIDADTLRYLVLEVDQTLLTDESVWFKLEWQDAAKQVTGNGRWFAFRPNRGMRRFVFDLTDMNGQEGFNAWAGTVQAPAITTIWPGQAGDVDPATRTRYDLIAFTDDPGLLADVFDGDGDGMIDTWEMQYFGNTTTADRTTDFDNDGHSDLEEYVAGTDPCDPNSPGLPTWRFNTDGFAEGWEQKNSVTGATLTVADGMAKFECATQGSPVRPLPYHGASVDVTGTRYLVLWAEFTLTDTSYLPPEGVVMHWWWNWGGWGRLAVNFPPNQINAGMQRFVYDLANGTNVLTGRSLELTGQPWGGTVDQVELDVNALGTGIPSDKLYGQHLYIDLIALTDDPGAFPPGYQNASRLRWNMDSPEGASPWTQKPSFAGVTQTFADGFMKLEDDGGGAPRFGPWTDGVEIDPAGTQFLTLAAELTMTNVAPLGPDGLIVDFWYLAGTWHQLKLNFPTNTINAGVKTFVFDLVNHKNMNTGKDLPVVSGTAPWPVAFTQMEIDLGQSGANNLSLFAGQHFYVDYIEFSDHHPDVAPPVIQLNGPSMMTLPVGTPYIETATAYDDSDGDLTSEIVITGHPVDASTAGTYALTYNVLDGKGTAAVPVSRTVIVPEDFDEDGLPDWWEIRYFGNLGQGPQDDPDYDGQNNTTEYANHTDPADRNSRLPAASEWSLIILAVLLATAGLVATRRKKLSGKPQCASEVAHS